MKLTPVHLALALALLPAVLFAHRQESRSLVLSTGETVDFLAYIPEASSTGPLPLMLFLHGGGESGDDLEAVKKNGPPREIANGRDYPMIVISPLNPDRKGFWDEDRLSRFLDELGKEIEYDTSRLYLVGMSRGAYGAYRLAMEDPDRFAALLALCGAAPAPYAGWLESLPTWIIHGSRDSIIPVEESERMAAAIRADGGNVQLTIHPDADHDVWTVTFEDPATVEWLLQHQTPRHEELEERDP